jgi:hypothetical protein
MKSTKIASNFSIKARACFSLKSFLFSIQNKLGNTDQSSLSAEEKKSNVTFTSLKSWETEKENEMNTVTNWWLKSDCKCSDFTSELETDDFEIFLFIK